MSRCMYFFAVADLLLTSIRFINFTQGNKDPGFLRCWHDSNHDPIPVTVACLIYHSANSKITLTLYLLRSLFAITLLIQRWRYPKCVLLTWLTSQFTELSMQIYTWSQVGFWHPDPCAVLQFLFKVFILYSFLSDNKLECRVVRRFVNGSANKQFYSFSV